MSITNPVALAIVASAMGVTGAGASAQWSQSLELMADDTAAGDYFGFSVAISQGTTILGAWRDDDAGQWSGSAYLFDATTGGQLLKLTATDADANDQFGVNVSIDGGICIVGAQGNDHSGLDDPGAAYVFDVATGQQLHKLTADDAGADAQFGNPVALSGGIAVIGAFKADDPADHSGAAYLFDAVTGEQLCKLIADDITADDRFGRAVAIDGDVAIVGANFADAAGSEAGAAYLFDVTTCSLLHQLTADDAEPFDHLGVAVTIQGDTAVVGAPGEDDEGVDAGAVYVFDVLTGQQLLKLTASDAAADDGFGREVSIDDGVVLIGAPRDDDPSIDSGSAYLFDVTTGEELAKLSGADAGGGDQTGRSVAIDGGVAIAGAHRHDHAGFDAGSAFVFALGSCPSDVDGDGSVDVTDLVAVVLDWGCAGEPGECAADVSRDGIVDVLDLIAVITSWGACP